MFNFQVNIFHLIVDLLVQKDKLECMTVCQQWYNNIYPHSLFRVICIDNQKQLDQLIAKVERDPVLGTKVQQLHLELKLDVEFDSNIFIELLPNLRCYTMINLNYVSAYSGLIEPYRNHPWCKYIEKIEGHFPRSLIRTLLLSGLCKNLTYISVSGPEHEPASDLIKSLVNAPNLKTLRLFRYTISFQDLELLHNTVSLLDSLWMRNITFESVSSPLSVQPATSLKHFQISNCFFGSHDAYSAFLLYISKKYTHIEGLELEFDPFISIYTGPENDRIVLKSYLTTLGSKLKIFSPILDLFELGDYASSNFDILDECGCQIEKLNLNGYIVLPTLEELAETTQAQFVQSLTVNRIHRDEYRSDFNIRPFSYTWLLRFTSLKELELQSVLPCCLEDARVLNLTVILENLYETRLERLEMHNVHLHFNESSRIPVYPSLKSLTLVNTSFETGTDTFISSVFTNLKHLALENCFEEKTSFMFPSLNLSSLEITNETIDDTLLIMMHTLGDGQKRLYSARTKQTNFQSDKCMLPKDMIPLPSISSRPFDGTGKNPTPSITCYSVYNFAMWSIRY